MNQRLFLDNICWTWQQLKGMRLRIAGSFAIGLIRIAASLSFVWICKEVVDCAISGGQHIWQRIAAMIAIILIQMGVGAWAIRVREKNRMLISNSLRSHIFGRVMRSEWHGREALHTGDTVNRLEDDIRTLTSAIAEQIPQIALAFVQLIAASFVLFSMQRNLLWVLLIIMPVALIVSKVYFRILRRITAEIREQDSRIQSHLQESLLKRILLLSMQREDASIDQLGEMQNGLMQTTMTRVSYGNRSRIFIQLGFMGGYVVTFCWSAFGLISGAVTYGMMTACLQLVNQVQSPIIDMSRQLPAMIQALTSVDRLRELADMREEPRSKVQQLPGPTGVRLEKVSFSYPGNQAPTLKDFSYDFAPGSHTAIVGPTGAGKSTLMRLILSLLSPGNGRVILYNRDKELPMNASLRCNFCYVPQGNSLMSGTVRQNLLLGNAEASEEDMCRALRLAAAEFVFDRPEGLDTPCSEQGSGLSEGQAQRIAIARALLQKGGILLLDEPCASVDPLTEQRILSNLSESASNHTIIWITHHTAVESVFQNVLKL